MPLTPSQVRKRLEEFYGHRPWEARYDPLSGLILGILSQNTSDRNSRPAFEQLKARFKDWEEVMSASTSEIATAIRGAGLSQVKAGYIKETLREIRQRCGSLDLSFLGSLPLEEAKAWLASLPGIGPKTAAVVLLFSLRRPALPVDTHVYRVALRLGLIPAKTSREKAHQMLEAKLDPEEVYAFHVLLLEHGRRICRARQPLCSECPFDDDCPSSGNRSKS